MKHLGACQLELFSLTVSTRMLVVYYGNRVEEDLIGAISYVDWGHYFYENWQRFVALQISNSGSLF